MLTYVTLAHRSDLGASKVFSDGPVEIRNTKQGRFIKAKYIILSTTV